MKKILITGSTGLIGSHIVSLLENEKDCQVLAAMMPHELESYIANANVEKISNEEIFKGNIHQIDVVINCAFARSNNAQDLASGIDFTKCLIAGLQQCKANAVINISSQGVYQRLPAGLMSDENSPIEPIDLYSMAKYAVEQMFLLADIPHVANVRLSSVAMRQRFLYKWIEAVKNNNPITLNSPNAYASLMDVRDVASGLVALASSNPSLWAETYNLGTGQQLSLQEWAKQVMTVGVSLKYSPTIEINDNGNNTSAGMSIQRLTELTSWKPAIDSLQMIKDMYLW